MEGSIWAKAGELAEDDAGGGPWAQTAEGLQHQTREVGFRSQGMRSQLCGEPGRKVTREARTHFGLAEGPKLIFPLALEG